MSNWISWFIICLITIICDTYIYSKISEKKIKKITLKMIVLILIVALINSISSFHIPQNIKFIFNFLVLLIYFKILFNDHIAKNVGTTFFIYLIMAVSEVLLLLILTGVFNLNLNVAFSKPIILICFNIFLMYIAIFIFSIKFIKKTLTSIIHWYSSKDILNLIIIIVVCCYAIFNVFMENSLGKTTFIEYITSNFIVLLFAIFIMFFLKEKVEKTKITYEYDNLLDYVKTYENLFDLQVKDLHEFKNQLIIIRDMASNKKLKDYITNLIDDREKNLTDVTTEKLRYMPSGGLKGLLIFKTQKMKQLKINYYVDVDEDFKNKEVIKACDKNLKDISRIIGVFIDNAIEATSKTDDKYLIIEARYEKNRIKFSISNSFKGKIDFQSIDQEGYSTKGPGKGYGLALVKQILRQNKNLTNVKEINTKFFVQHLIINTKTSSIK